MGVRSAAAIYVAQRRRPVALPLVLADVEQVLDLVSVEQCYPTALRLWLILTVLAVLA